MSDDLGGVSVLVAPPADAWALLSAVRANASERPADPRAAATAAAATGGSGAVEGLPAFGRLLRASRRSLWLTAHQDARSTNESPTLNPADEDQVKARGKELVEKGFGLMDKALEGKDFVVGPFSIADSALFYVEFWGAKRMNMKLPANCEAHLNRMMTRPAVQRVLKQEGLT